MRLSELKWHLPSYVAMFVSFFVYPIASATVFLPPAEMKLSSAEKREVEDIACRPHGERVTRIVGTGFGIRVMGAAAVCAGQHQVDGRRIYREVDCYRGETGQDWNCGGAQFAEVKIDRELVRVVADPSIISDAVGAVRFLMKEKIYVPEKKSDITTDPDTWYQGAIVSASDNGVIKVERGGGQWHFVEVVKSSKQIQYRYLGNSPPPAK